jgi:general secretion pathway protein C
MKLQDLVKRHYWVVGVATVGSTAFLVGRTGAHVAEGLLLTDAAQAAKVDRLPRADAPDPAATVARSKAGGPLGDRNIFCSECLPAAPVAAAPTEASSDGVVRTALPLKLIATFVGPGGRDGSLATILNTETQAQGGYVIGASIPGAGPVVAITYRAVDFDNKATGRRERVSLLDEPPRAAPPPVAAAAPADTGAPKDELAASLDAGIRKIDEFTFEVDRALIDKLLANPLAASKGARVTPSMKNGKPNGIKLYAVRPSSIYAKLGLSNGDTIHSFNGNELDSLDKGLEIYQKVKDASSLQVSVTRRGKPVNLQYTIK